MKNGYEYMLAEIRDMQSRFAELSKKAKKDPDIEKAVTALCKVRSALEILWLRSLKK